MTERHTASRLPFGPTKTSCLHRTRTRDNGAPSGAGGVHRPPHRLRRRRVDLARQRLAAGRYDSEELLDTVLDLVIEDLTE